MWFSKGRDHCGLAYCPTIRKNRGVRFDLLGGGSSRKLAGATTGSSGGTLSISRPERLVWLAGCAAVTAALAARRLGDFDLPWHLAHGRIVASTGTVPAIDDLAYTNQPIQYSEFVADTLLYETIHWMGPLGLQVLRGILLAATLTMLAWGQRRGPTGPIVASFAMAAASAWFVTRPATFSFVLLAITTVAIERHRSAPQSIQGRGALLLLIPLHLVWANVHGFVVVGLTLVVGYALYRAACSLARGSLDRWLPASDAGQLRWAGGAACGSLVATLINNGGAKLLTAPLRIGQDVGRVTEWAPTTWSFVTQREPAVGLLAVVVLVALLFGRDPKTRNRLPALWDLAVLTLAVYLALSAVRLIAVGVIVAAPWAIRRLSKAIPSSSVTRAAASLCPWLLGIWLCLRPGVSFGVGFEPDHFPEAAVGFIQDQHPQGRMWNSSVYGGYLSWRLYPEYRVLIDGRTSWVHDPRIVKLAYQSEQEPEAFTGLVSEFDIEWAICRSVEGEPFGVPLAASPDWTMVFWDDVSAVYVSTKGRNAKLADEGYRLLRHMTPMSVVLSLALRAERVRDLTYDAKLAESQAPYSARAAFLSASAALGRRDEARFGEALRRVRTLSELDGPVMALEASWKRAMAPIQ